MEQKIKLENAEDILDGKKLFKDCFVDLNSKPKPLDTMVYFGIDDRNNRVPAMTRGEFSCILAPSKAKKTFAKSLITSAYIGGDTSDYTEHILGNRQTDGYIVELDTEQGEYYAHRAFNRTRRMVGGLYEKYIPLQARKKSVSERLALIEWMVYESEFSGEIDFLTIDGIADLVYDTNDIKEANIIAEKLLKWTGEGMHICLVIHKNPNGTKARGHLGTAITIKAETLILMDRLYDDNGQIREKNTVKISCSHTRGMDFEDFYLSVNDEGLPFTHSEEVYNKLDSGIPF